MAFQKQNAINKYDSETSLLNHFLTFRTIFIRTSYGANYCAQAAEVFSSYCHVSRIEFSSIESIIFPVSTHNKHYLLSLERRQARNSCFSYP